MRILITTLLLSAFSALNAQYHPFAVPGRQWNELQVKQFSQGKWMNYYQIGDSLALNGRSLPTVLKVGYSGNIEDTLLLIREDTASKVITFINYDWEDWRMIYGDSVVLNLGLSIGDSAPYPCRTDTIYYILDSTSIVSDNQSIARTKYHFTSSGQNWNQKFVQGYFSWTEGLGSIDWWGGSFGYFLPLHCLSDFSFLDIICITDSDGSLLHRHRDYNTCQPLSTCYVKIEELKLYPNPAHDLLRIENTANIKSVEILDMTGQIQRSWSFSGGDPVLEINLDGLSPGVYIVKSTRGTSLSVRKIIVQ